jgi:hypothetical protein
MRHFVKNTCRFNFQTIRSAKFSKFRKLYTCTFLGSQIRPHGARKTQKRHQKKAVSLTLSDKNRIKSLVLI